MTIAELKALLDQYPDYYDCQFYEKIGFNDRVYQNVGRMRLAETQKNCGKVALILEFTDKTA